MKILIADDNSNLRELLSRLFSMQSHEVVMAEDGVKAIELAGQAHPDIILLDVTMPRKDGYEVCRELRQNINTRFIPILFLTASREMSEKITGLMSGADDYITKPFDVEELSVRVTGLFNRSKLALSANPLTRIPGGSVIEEEAARRIQAKEPFAFAYIDIDNFKVYNDVYGYQKGDEVIRNTASILIESIKKMGTSEDFIGHIGGDDFVVIARPERIQALAHFIAGQFDAQTPSFYNEADRQSGYVETLDRRGTKRLFPLMSISIAVVTNQSKPIEHYGRLVEIVTELKRYVKTMPDRKKSAVAMDRRGVEEPKK